MAYESREEIDNKYKWDLSSMFPSDEAFEVGLEGLKALAALVFFSSNAAVGT